MKLVRVGLALLVLFPTLAMAGGNTTVFTRTPSEPGRVLSTGR